MDSKQPELHSDLVADALSEIRARVLADRPAVSEDSGDESPTEQLTEAEKERVMAELREIREVDLNLEKHVSALEDPTLKAHMEACRRRLMEHERQMVRSPERKETFRQKFVEAMSAMHAVCRRVRDLNEEAREPIEWAFSIKSRLRELSAGKKPRGCPPDTAPIDFIAELVDKFATSFEEFHRAHGETENKIHVIRRDVGTVGQGLLDLLESSAEDRRLLKDYVQKLSQIKAARDTAEPPSTYGEKILASPLLPEDAVPEEFAGQN